MSRSIGTFIIGSIFTVMAYNNCSAVHDGDKSLSSFSICNIPLKDEFIQGYHPFLKNNCNSCHSSNGSGNGYFGDNNVDTAFDAFLVRGNTLVGSRALDVNHQPPFTGSQHTLEVNALDEAWADTKAQADRCLESMGHSSTTPIENGIIPEDPKPTKGTIQTFVKVIGASHVRKTLTWKLGTEIKTEGYSFANAEFSIDVLANTTINGEKSYILSNPKLKAGTESLHIILVEFFINNKLVNEATSFHAINRRVPSGETRDLGVGSMTFNYNFQSTDSIAISIGILEAINFKPPTFAQLIAPTGVLGANCLSCHDAATRLGGFDISTRALVIQQIKVSPYNPNNSEIFKRMNSVQAPMPQSGLLPVTDVEQVLQWIQNGAL